MLLSMVTSMGSVVAALLFTSSAVVASRQLPFSGASYASSAFSSNEPEYMQPTINIELPFESSSQGFSSSSLRPSQLIAAQNGSFARLTHQDFPTTSVRIKRHASAKEKGTFNTFGEDPTAFCDPGVVSWTGYIDSIDGKSIFFYLFESRNNPESDPVVSWTNGGPGASSSIGLFMEHGPCRVPKEERTGPPSNGTDYFPYSWNSRANVLYIEQPVGVGFSYHRFGGEVGTTAEAAKDIYAFLRIFFSAFEQFRGNDFHISGESYWGKYWGEWAREIWDGNTQVVREAKKHGQKPAAGSIINFKSALIGNGVQRRSLSWQSYYDNGCTTKGGYAPKLDVGQCAEMRRWLKRCTDETKKHCEDAFNFEACLTSENSCSDQIMEPWLEMGYNPYDMTDDCKAGIGVLCYDETAYIAKYLDRDDVRSLIGAAPRSLIGKYKASSNTVARNFNHNGDGLTASTDYIVDFLERGLPILVYVGAADWICSVRWNLPAIDALEFPGKINFAKSLKDWRADGRVVGQTAKGGNLTFATVHGAGHMVPYKTEHAIPALAMFNRWLSGEKL